MTWRFVPLPLRTMPWNPTARLCGSGDVAALPVFPSAFAQLKAIVGYTGAEMDVQLQEHEMEVRPDPDSEEGTGTETEWSHDCSSDKAQCGLVEKVL